MHYCRIVAVSLAMAIAGITTTTATAPAAPDRCAFEVWGAQTLGGIQAAFFLPDRGLYAEQVNDAKTPRPSWLWDASIQLGALTAAARLEPDTYLPAVKAYAAALRSYRTENHGRPGLDVNPPPKSPDRYYDDNAWIVLALLEAYDLTHDSQTLALALDAYHFTMSGEDNALGGGIYWHEDNKRSKNACSCGPASLDALRLFEVTHDPAYLQTARRLYEWMRAHLQDSDGLIFDSIGVADGRISRAKYTYNSATLIEAGSLLYQITRDHKYLDEAERVAQAAEKRWIRPQDGLIPGAGKLAVKLVEALLVLRQTDHDDHWLAVVDRCLVSLGEHRDANGWYPMNWQASPPPATAPVRLIDQSAVARAYWLAASVHAAMVR